MTKDANIKPKVNAINVAKKDTVKEFFKGTQKIFSLIDEVNTLSTYLYVNSPSFPPESIASIIVKDTEFEKIETIGAITRYDNIITKTDPIIKVGCCINFKNFIFKLIKIEF